MVLAVAAISGGVLNSAWNRLRRCRETPAGHTLPRGRTGRIGIGNLRHPLSRQAIRRFVRDNCAWGQSPLLPPPIPALLLAFRTSFGMVLGVAAISRGVLNSAWNRLRRCRETPAGHTLPRGRTGRIGIGNLRHPLSRQAIRRFVRDNCAWGQSPLLPPPIPALLLAFRTSFGMVLGVAAISRGVLNSAWNRLRRCRETPAGHTLQGGRTGRVGIGNLRHPLSR